jgi:hypothetical protein
LIAWSIAGDGSTGPAVHPHPFIPALAEEIVGLSDQRLAGGALLGRPAARGSSSPPGRETAPFSSALRSPPDRGSGDISGPSAMIAPNPAQEKPLGFIRAP